MSEPGDPPIVVSGGSITITIPGGIFPGLPVAVDLTNPLKEIKRVEITGSGIENYSATADGSDITIKIEYGNPK
jgi:hypothetical protein